MSVLTLSETQKNEFQGQFDLFVTLLDGEQTSLTEVTVKNFGLTGLAKLATDFVAVCSDPSSKDYRKSALYNFGGKSGPYPRLDKSTRLGSTNTKDNPLGSIDFELAALDCYKALKPFTTLAGQEWFRSVRPLPVTEIIDDVENIYTPDSLLSFEECLSEVQNCIDAFANMQAKIRFDSVVYDIHCTLFGETSKTGLIKKPAQIDLTLEVETGTVSPVDATSTKSVIAVPRRR
jgi:hypothetical protein